MLRKTADLTFHTSSHKHLSRCQRRATLLGCQYLICSKIKSRVIRPSSSSQEFSAGAELDVRKLPSKAYGIFCPIWPGKLRTVSVHAPYRCTMPAHSTPLCFQERAASAPPPLRSHHTAVVDRQPWPLHFCGRVQHSNKGLSFALSNGIISTSSVPENFR